MKNPTTIIVLLLLFFPVGLYFMWKREVWSLETRVVLSLIFFFPLGLYVMWKEKELWSKKTKIIITIGVLLVVIFIPKESRNSSSSSNSLSNECSDMKFYNLGVYGGNEDSSVMRDCDSYWELVETSTDPREIGPDSFYCFCKGYDSIKKEF